MAHVDKSVLVPYSAGLMYSLVDDVESYPRFLPWCGGSKVLTREPGMVVATVAIDFHGLRQSFTTRNTPTPGRRMDIALVDGPFRKLDGAWRFTPLGEDACKVELTLDYEFASRLLEKLVGPVFNHIAQTLVEAFTQRAGALNPGLDGPGP